MPAQAGRTARGWLSVSVLDPPCVWLPRAKVNEALLDAASEVREFVSSFAMVIETLLDAASVLRELSSLAEVSEALRDPRSVLREPRESLEPREELRDGTRQAPFFTSSCMKPPPTRVVKSWCKLALRQFRVVCGEKCGDATGTGDKSSGATHSSSTLGSGWKARPRASAAASRITETLLGDGSGRRLTGLHGDCSRAGDGDKKEPSSTRRGDSEPVRWR